jgi:hypothetical protein
MPVAMNFLPPRLIFLDRLVFSDLRARQTPLNALPLKKI